MLSDEQRGFQSLLEIAQDLTASLAADDRYARLLAAVRRVVPFDAACLLRLEGEALVPVAGHGLRASALVRRYERREHPRLDAILRAPGPVRFPPDSPLPDPFDGAIEADPEALSHIHACLGCPLREGDQVVGVLAADALKAGAFDLLNTRLLATLGALAGAAMRTTALIEAIERRADHRSRVAQELQRSASEHVGGQLLGSSPAVRRMREEIALVAASDLAVLITGETGVGKELVAHHIHEASARRDEALIQVNCAALPVSIAESELFGHVAGAFTGAARDRAGKFEVAHQGTLFLDEIGELPLELQPKLLRVLQQGEVQRVGSDRVHRVDVRIIAATNRSLSKEIERGRFRADLYHRLAVFPLRVPPLRERREDIPVLAAAFVDAAVRRLGLLRARLDEDARLALVDADWPGNVRELENVVSRAVLRASSGRERDEPVVVTAAHLGAAEVSRAAFDAATEPAAGVTTAGLSLRRQTEEFQRRVIEDAVARAGRNWAAAARELGLHRSNLHHLAERLGLREGNGRHGHRR